MLLGARSARGEQSESHRSTRLSIDTRDQPMTRKLQAFHVAPTPPDVSESKWKRLVDAFNAVAKKFLIDEHSKPMGEWVVFAQGDAEVRAAIADFTDYEWEGYQLAVVDGKGEVFVPNHNLPDDQQHEALADNLRRADEYGLRSGRYPPRVDCRNDHHIT